MMTMGVDGQEFGEAWRTLLGVLAEQEPDVAPRGYQTRECINLRFNVENMNRNMLVDPVRKINYRFAVAEWLWIWFGMNELAPLCRYIKDMGKFSDDGLTLAGAYGPRLYPQWEYVFHKLREDKHTRQAVMSIWTPSPYKSKDIPCTLTFQFLIRQDKLHLLVNMRSSDVWLGLPYDFFSFTMLANLVAAHLEIEPGCIQFNLASSHLYERDREKALKIIQADDTMTCSSPVLTSMPPRELQMSLLDGVEIGENSGLRSRDVNPIWREYSNVLFKAQNNEDALLLMPKVKTFWHGEELSH